MPPILLSANPLRRFPILILLLSVLAAGCKAQEKSNAPPKAITPVIACTFSEIAYCSDPQQKLDKHLPGWKVVWDGVPTGSICAFVATDGNNYIVTIRGSLVSFTTDALTNWIYHDLNVAVQDKWPYSIDKKARISQGSYIGWQNLEKMKDKQSGQSLWLYLSKNLEDQSPLLLTGHSLGGNLATVYASWLWHKFNEVGKPRTNMNVINFAAPAAGNDAFANDFQQRFPASVRIENSNDIVPKFPCSKDISGLGRLFASGPSASEVNIGYNNMTIKLSQAFSMLSTTLDLFELRSDFYGYAHTPGQVISIPVSGKNSLNTAAGWFAEAGYQHGIERYAAALGAPIISCD